MEATAVSLARSVLDGVLSSAGSAVADEVARLLGVPREVEFIRNELEMMQSFLRAASASASAPPGAAADTAASVRSTWVKQVRDLAYDVEDCLLDFALYAAVTSSSSSSRGCRCSWAWLRPGPLATRHRIATRIRELRASVEELNQRNQRYQIAVDPPAAAAAAAATAAVAAVVAAAPAPPQPPRAGAGAEDQQPAGPGGSVLPDHHDAHELAFQEWDMIGRSREKAELTALISGSGGAAAAAALAVVSVWGMGGMGKSSLVSTVRNDPVLLDAFDCGAWVTVPHPLDSADEVRRRLRNQLGVAAADGQPDIRDYLQDKRYVIVVDDVLSQEEWDHVWQVFNFPNGKGSRVVVTTRREDVARHCAGSGEGHGHVYELKPLGHDESKHLLCQKVYKTTEYTSKEMAEQASHILKRCRGLPLAISTIGGLLANRPKTSMEWMKLHEHLGAELESDLRNITKVIVSSYDGLPYHLKSIFLYLSIFPENHEIRCTRLLRRWMAEGYVAKNRDMPVEEVGERFYNELINRSMIQPSKKMFIPGARVDRCRIHSMVRQIILSKSIEENQLFIIEKHCNEVPQSKIRHLVVSRWKREEKLENINMSYIRSLTVFGDCPVSLISPKMCLLRVLDLEDAINVKHEDLRHIGQLHHLRYLSLRGTDISKLPSSLQNLRYLETLDIQDTQVTHLPHGIVKLEKLRYLLAGVDFSRDLLQKVAQSEMDNQTANLLGNMTSFLCCNRSDYCRISNMDRFSVRAPEGIEKLRNLHKFGVFNVGQGNGVAGRLQKLTNLQRLGVTATGLSEEEGQELCKSIEKLGRLQRLEVRSDSLEFLTKMNESALPKHLASLRLCGNLSRLPKWIGALNDLAKVKLLGTQLEQGEVEQLGKLCNVAFLGLWENSYIGDSLHFDTGRFPKLKFLDIDGLEKIETVAIEEGAMPELEQLWVNNCKALHDSGDGLSGVPHLPNLNELLLKKCGEKEELMKILQRQVSEHIKRPKFLIGKVIIPTTSKPTTSATTEQ